MRHLTLTTGDQRESAREEIADDVIEKLTFLLRRRTGSRFALPWVEGVEATATAQGTALMVTFWRGRAPLVMFGVAPYADAAKALWPLLLQQEKSVGMQREQHLPPAPPWCVAVLLPGLALHMDDARWLGDAERCFAWAWVDLQAS